ncbi:MAG: ArsR/SmtB family transcription factor [Microgenomates group bacterium]
MVDVLKAFASLPRVKLVLCLKKGKKNVSQLIKSCGLSQSAVSQHLAKLKDWGLVEDEKKGKEVFYKIKKRGAISICEKLYRFVKKPL